MGEDGHIYDIIFSYFGDNELVKVKGVDVVNAFDGGIVNRKKERTLQIVEIKKVNGGE